MYDTLWCDVLKYIPFYKAKVMMYFDAIVSKKTVYLWPFNHALGERAFDAVKIPCHVIMYNTEIVKMLTLMRVQITLSLRQDLNIIVSLASIGKPNMIRYNPIFVLCMQ